MFDCPPESRSEIRWKIQCNYDEQPWNIGLIVGPSGCGKSTIGRELFGEEVKFDWHGDSLIDCFAESASVEDISTALSSVGFSTIPAWIKPFEVLSTGEKFRADIARRMLECQGTILIDEYTSVIDRQVAKVASNSVQKYVRNQNKQLVAVSCHSDVIDWLQPDWIIEPAKNRFHWRSLRQRPSINIEVARIPYEAWDLFKRFHYMSNDMHRAARCFGLWANGHLAAFMGVLHRPHAKADNIKAVSRIVTHPDWQGLGLAFNLMNTVGSAYKALGFRFRNNPAHPQFVRAHRKDNWTCVKLPGKRGPTQGKTTTIQSLGNSLGKQRHFAVFEYIGPAMEKELANQLIA